MKPIILVASLMLLAGCGSSSGGSAPTSSKELFSLWTRTSGQGELDLRSLTFDNGMDIMFVVSGVGSCRCRFTVDGTQQSGTYSIYSCSQVTGNYNCVNFAGSGTFTNQNATLSLCDSGGCVTYR